MTLEWSVFAIADRKAIFDYIEAGSPQAAITIDERIEEAVESLKEFPEKAARAASMEHENL